MKPTVIIGAGHAGLTTARELRQLDKDIEIIVISKDPVCAYYKPNLSKALAMNKSAKQLIMKTAGRLENDLQITTFSNSTVISIDPVVNEIVISGSLGTENIEYKNLVLAMGASPITLPIVGDAKDDILTINSLEDYGEFREAIGNNAKVLIIGSGFVGCELASDLTSSNYHVDIVDLSPWPMQRIIPKEIGDAISGSFPKDLAKWHMNTSVVKATKSKGMIDVYLSNGKVITVDVVVSAAGLSPNCELAFDSGIKVSGGISVDDNLTTNIKNIYALGDCAEINGHNLPFISPATLAAKALSKTLSGESTALQLLSLEVAVKISTCPLIVSPSLKKTGQWVTEGKGVDFVSRFIDDNGDVLGFALSGSKIADKNMLIKESIASTFNK